MISRLEHNCLDKCLYETRDQDTTFETKIKAVNLKTKTVKILSQNETVSRDFPSLCKHSDVGSSKVLEARIQVDRKGRTASTRL